MGGERSKPKHVQLQGIKQLQNKSPQQIKQTLIQLIDKKWTNNVKQDQKLMNQLLYQFSDKRWSLMAQLQFDKLGQIFEIRGVKQYYMKVIDAVNKNDMNELKEIEKSIGLRMQSSQYQDQYKNKKQAYNQVIKYIATCKLIMHSHQFHISKQLSENILSFKNVNQFTGYLYERFEIKQLSKNYDAVVDKLAISDLKNQQQLFKSQELQLLFNMIWIGTIIYKYIQHKCLKRKQQFQLQFDNLVPQQVYFQLNQIILLLQQKGYNASIEKQPLQNQKSCLQRIKSIIQIFKPQKIKVISNTKQNQNINEAINQNLNKLQATCKQFKDKYEKEIKDLTQQFRKAQEKIKKIQQTLDDQRKNNILKIKELENNLASEIKLKNEKQQAVQSLKNQSKQTIFRIQNQHQESIRKLNKTIKSHQETITKLSAQITSKDNKTKIMQDSINKGKQQISRLLQSMKSEEDLLKSLSQKNQQIIKLNEGIDNMKFKYNQLDNQNRKILLQNKQLTIKLSEDICIAQYLNGKILDQHTTQLTKWLINKLQHFKVRKIFKTILVYQYDKFNTTNFHKYIDGHSNLVLIIKLKNGNIVGGFTEDPFSKGADMKNKRGFLYNLNKRRLFELKSVSQTQDNMEPQPITWNQYEIIYGNAEIRIRLNNPYIFSNFSSGNAFYRSQGVKVSEFLGDDAKNTRQSQFETYELHQVYFEK